MKKAPWDLWMVGLVTLAWNGMGALDYVMTQTKNPAYMAQFTPEQLDFFYSFPSWVEASWATAVWGGVLGSLLLLLRNKFAPIVFALSFVAMAVTSLYSFVLSNVKMTDVAGPESLVFSAAIFVVGLLTYLYARTMRSKGYLR